MILQYKFEELYHFDGPGGKYIKMLMGADGVYESSHTHDYYEITLFVSGDSTVIINGEEYECEKGSFFILSPTEEHSHYNKKGTNTLVCAFRKETPLKYLSLWLNNFGAVIKLSENDISMIQHLFAAIDNELWEDKHMCDEVANAFLDDILLVAYRNFCNYLQDDFDWDALRFYLAQNFLSITLNEAAEYFGISKEYFCKIFKKKFGVTLGGYLKQLRIQRAKELLISTNKSIIEIAFELGYASSGKFFSDFKKITNMTPAHFRKLNKSGF